MALEQKQREYNWYFTQCFVEVEGETYSKVVRFVTFAKTPNEAKNIALDYVFANKAKLGLPVDDACALMKEDIYLYQKNYIRDSRALVQAGKYAGEKPASV